MHGHRQSPRHAGRWRAQGRLHAGSERCRSAEKQNLEHAVDDKTAIAGGYRDEFGAIVRDATGVRRVLRFDRTLDGSDRPG